MMTSRTEDMRAILEDVNTDLSVVEEEISTLEKKKDELHVLRKYCETKLQDPVSYSGMTATEAAVDVLRELGPPKRGTQEIIGVMAKRGYESKAKNVYESIFGSLAKKMQKPDSLLTRHKGKWGLKEWDQETADAGPPVESALSKVRN